jgi:hypothetical protein
MAWIYVFAFISTADLVNGFSLLPLDYSVTGVDFDYTVMTVDGCIAVFAQGNFHVLP